MTDDNLQDQYKDQLSSPIEEKVHLAADSAHYISEYLNSVAFEFAREGVLDLYVITNRIEETIIQKLKRRSIEGKIPLEVVKEILTEMPTPQDLVKSYINDNNPVRRPFLAGLAVQSSTDTIDRSKNEISIDQSSELFSTQNSKSSDQDVSPVLQLKRPVDERTEVPQFIQRLFQRYDLYLKAFIYLIFIAATIISFTSIIFQFAQLGLDVGFYIIMLFASSSVALIELITGIYGVTVISKSNFVTLRWGYFNLILLSGLIASIIYAESIFQLNRYWYDYNLFITIWISIAIVFSAIIIHDFAPGLVALQSKWRSPVRFLTPSYLIFTTSVVMISISYVLWFNTFNPDYWWQPAVRLAYILMIGGGLLALISTYIDSYGIYPISHRKVFSILLFPFAFDVRSDNLLFGSIYQGQLVTEFVFLILPGIFVLIFIFLIYIIYKEEASQRIVRTYHKISSTLNHYKIRWKGLSKNL